MDSVTTDKQPYSNEENTVVTETVNYDEITTGSDQFHGGGGGGGGDYFTTTGYFTTTDYAIQDTETTTNYFWTTELTTATELTTELTTELLTDFVYVGDDYRVKQAKAPCTEELEWQDDAARFVEFRGIENTLGEVNTTLWLQLQAFSKCDFTTEDLERANIFISNVAIEGYESYIETETASERKTEEGKSEVIASDESETGFVAGPSIILHRWREYEIEVTAVDPKTNRQSVAEFPYNTFEWKCNDSEKTIIRQNQFCDGTPHCLNGNDEDREICQVSQLPKKLSNLLFVYTLTLIFAYFLVLRDHIAQPEGLHLHMISRTAFRQCLFQKEKHEFKAIYAEMHQSQTKFGLFIKELKYETYRNLGKMVEVFEWIKEAEEEMHSNPEAIYNCILDNFGGTCCLTSRITDPSGGVLYKIKSRIDKIVLPKKVKWHILSIIVLFVMLCLHMFDYVKDIGKCHIPVT